MSRRIGPASLAPSVLLATPVLAAAIVGLLFAAHSAIAAEPTASDVPAAPPDFNREVRPILAQHCFKCHGPDDKIREGGLRLDTSDGARLLLDSGARAVVPGDVAASELIRRIEATDADLVMPPPATKKTLTAEQKSVLKRWVADGAKYQPHWAFVAPRQAPLPPVADRGWARSPLDVYVQAGLDRERLAPSPEADRHALARRASLDLLGEPPTPDEADAFVEDRSPDAYERLLDRLLASPRYGERWARRWLDLARYADTNGYEKDRPRSIWPYRDWVIRALNADLPFNQFSIEQLAGDMLPNATLDQRVATGFHRNTMINEEGGIDPLEFRFHAMVDRMNTTGTTWLGLTLVCSYCHTHKFDPIPQTEYYGMFAMLNNADEPEIAVPQADLAWRRAELETQIARLEEDLPNQFPPEGELRWSTPRVVSATAASGAKLEPQDDGSLLVTGANPDVDRYTIVLESDAAEVAALKLETLTHPSLGGNGPGRTPHGNFVLTELSIQAAPVNPTKASDVPDAPGAVAAPKPGAFADSATTIKIAGAEAEIEQDTFPIADAFDGNPKTGWAIHGTQQPLNRDRAATFRFATPVGAPAAKPAEPPGAKPPATRPTRMRWTVQLDQQFGKRHTIGRFRIQLAQSSVDARPIDERRRAHLDNQFARWLTSQEARAVAWTTLRPASATSNLPLLTILDDDSVLASGDQSKSDLYELRFENVPAGVTALRIEAMADERLPKGGPGRVYYEGPHGDFWLSDIRLAARGPTGDWLDQPFGRASQSFANGGNNATAALDDNKQTGWSINGGQGRSHTAVFNLAQPTSQAGSLVLKMLFERYYAAGLGRFRVSFTTDPRAQALDMPPEIERLLATPGDKRTAGDRAKLLKHYLSVAPELSGPRQAIQNLRQQLPTFPTTLVFVERPPNNPRPTFRHHRGEFLQPKEAVQPGVLSILPGLPPGAPLNRLSFARWLVDPANPLVGRVTMNRHWAALFGRGIVRTTEDFGYQGESPSNPELLDWLAVELVRQEWSIKRMHRIVLGSATYRQSSRVTPQLLERDRDNRLLARGPRVRLEAELIRDTLLKTSGLLSTKIGGPSVFPPQPANVTTEGAYGQLAWKTSEGGDRYRRGLYTFSKRTAPYAMFTTFDGPSGEACVARRELSNTPLQALTLLNDAVFLDAAQALGRMIAAEPGDDAARAARLFRRCLTRPPTEDEWKLVVAFHARQKQRLAAGELNPRQLAGAPPNEPPRPADPGVEDKQLVEQAAWTATARAILNLDEFITKE